MKKLITIKVLTFKVSKNFAKVNDFVNQAATADPKDFSGLIKRVIALLKKKQKAAKSMLVDGRLVHLAPSGQVTIIGDLHGDLESLTYILKDSGFLKKNRKHENVYLIFLGDYGDRGKASPEVYHVVLKLKELFPEKVILMRGNHEGPEDLIPIPHDLPTQLAEKYGEEAGAKIYAELRELFNYLYCAVFVDERSVLIHGGLPSNASSLRDLAYAHKKHPKESHLEEMLWSDPEEGLKGVQPSPRGAGKLFGIDVTDKLLQMLGVKVLIRGHESCGKGFKINHKGRILTLFSTNKPPYSNKYGAYLQLNLAEKITDAEQLKQHIKQF
jgi:diadenosine tetraphosphatase ApaH/serine/threonine PP2A family protein phosphatase